MNLKLIFTICFAFIVLSTMIITSIIYADTLYVDSKKGDDANPGTEEKPLRSIGKAVFLVNSKTEGGPTTIKIAPGIYTLVEPVIVKNDRPYTEENRMVIEATILPDDPEWKPPLMPVILSTVSPQQPAKSGAPSETSGLKIEINHVTIRGLKFLGNPIMEVWYYPIFREGKSLEDLIVTQCLFIMDSNALTSNVAVLANGHGLVIDHCIFYHCRNPVVFWNAEGGISRANAMRYCIVEGAYTSAVWVCQTGEDFEFHHNIITRSEYVWMRDYENKRTYQLHDCIITENKQYSAACGPNWEINLTGREIVFEEDNVVKEGNILLELGNGIDIAVPRNYLHVAHGTLGSELGAGLFIAEWKPEAVKKMRKESN